VTHGIFRSCYHSGRKLVLLGRTCPCTSHRPEERPHEAGCGCEWSCVDPHVKENDQVRIGEEEETDVVGICDVDLLP
jgi:hypothetical protein